MIFYDDGIIPCVEADDVKEFIRLLKEWKHPKVNHMITIPIEQLDKLAGDKLK